MCIGFGLIHVLSIERKRILVCSSSRHTLMNRILLPLTPHTPVILHEGLARSCRIHCFQKRRKTFSLGRRCTPGRMRGVRKCFCLALTHRLRRSPLTRRARVILWMMVSATLPSVPRRMTGGGRHTSKNESFQTKESNRKKVGLYVHS